MPTNIYVIGVFDMLHVGHYNLFYRCKSLAEDSKLLIGICCDDIVKLRKKRTPVMNEDERRRQIKKLDLVFDVFIYRELDNSKILNELKPNIFVVPPDYGYYDEHNMTLKTAADLDIKVIRLPRTEDISTTQLRKHNFIEGNLGCDFHDTITYNPSFFKFLFKSWVHSKKYIISGDKDKEEIRNTLNELGITDEMYDEILVTPYEGYSFNTKNHYDIVKDLKLNFIKEKNITVYFDDNPIYTEYLRNHTSVFYTALSDNYIDKFNSLAKHKNINFQMYISRFINNNYTDWNTNTSQIKKIESSESIENIAKQFWKNQVKYPKYDNIKQRRFYEIQYFIKKLGFDPISSFLDLGCGDGSFVKCIDNLLEIDRIYCLDLSESLMSSIVATERISKQVFDCSDPKYFSILPKADVIMFGAVINYIFDDTLVIELLKNFKAKHIFIRAMCTMSEENDLVNTFSVKLNSEYSCFYRTLDNTRQLIQQAGHKINEIIRIYPDEIESVFNTRQYMFYLKTD